MGQIDGAHEGGYWWKLPSLVKIKKMGVESWVVKSWQLPDCVNMITQARVFFFKAYILRR